MVHTFTLKTGCEHEYIEVLWIQAVYIRDVRTNTRYIIKSQNMYIDGYASSSWQEVTQTDAGKKEGKRSTTKVEQEIMIITSNKWSRQNSNKISKEEFWKP